MTNPFELRSERSIDLAIAGELNLDLILYGLPLVMETERELLGSAFVLTLGSSSAIVAHNAAMLGLRVRFATLVGDDDVGRIARIIVVKRGPLSCRIRDNGRQSDYAGVSVNPIDTIGAGDSFDAGFLCAYLRGMDIADSAPAGNIAGALSTLYSGDNEAFCNRVLKESFSREQGFPGFGD
jgi:sugar/nucleoside kinase (ribokinase family)